MSVQDYLMVIIQNSNLLFAMQCILNLYVVHLSYAHKKILVYYCIHPKVGRNVVSNYLLVILSCIVRYHTICTL